MTDNELHNWHESTQRIAMLGALGLLLSSVVLKVTIAGGCMLMISALVTMVITTNREQYILDELDRNRFR